ncbi:hypothetical protein EJ08DRAFT_656129 [Tothia fuscella]|uniref:RNase III domain-containing protein n=1 Tax=Tothia fuscella TaxID=1048955 RepID=A0A9P4P1U5_9PEZI|nr:hypothetical protein EJ08DRAFT_656129 [Tothia fuscella]
MSTGRSPRESVAPSERSEEDTDIMVEVMLATGFNPSRWEDLWLASDAKEEPSTQRTKVLMPLDRIGGYCRMMLSEAKIAEIGHHIGLAGMVRLGPEEPGESPKTARDSQITRAVYAIFGAIFMDDDKMGNFEYITDRMQGIGLRIKEMGVELW